MCVFHVQYLKNCTSIPVLSESKLSNQNTKWILRIKNMDLVKCREIKCITQLQKNDSVSSRISAGNSEQHYILSESNPSCQNPQLQMIHLPYLSIHLVSLTILIPFRITFVPLETQHINVALSRGQSFCIPELFTKNWIGF